MAAEKPTNTIIKRVVLSPAKSGVKAVKPSKQSKRNQTKHARKFDVDLVREHVTTLRPLHRRLMEAERVVALSKENWVSVGNKDIKQSSNDETTLALLKKEFGFIRNAARAVFGNRPVRFHAPMDFTITTTVTTGVTKTVLMGGSTALNASNLTEWSSFAALFDEVKVHGGTADFIYINPNVFGTALTTDSQPVIGFDPADATAAGSSSAVVQLARHKKLDTIASGGASTGATTGVHHRFPFEIPKGTFSDPSSAFCGDVWQPTSGPVAVGCLKFYHVGVVVTAIVTGAGHLFLDVSFRCRE